MAGRLAPLGGLARRIAAPQAVMPLKSGPGPMVALIKPPTKPVRPRFASPVPSPVTAHTRSCFVNPLTVPLVD